MISFSAIKEQINFSLQDKAESSKEQIRVASFNANFSKLLLVDASMLDGSDYKKFAEAFNSHQDLDVLCVQEIGKRTSSYIEKALSFPYHYEDQDYTLSIFSKFPISASGLVEFKSNIANSCVWIDVLVEKDTLRIYNAHLESNRFDGKVPAFINQDTPESVSLNTAIGLIQHYPLYSKIRTSQAQLIQAHRKTSLRKSIIVGDFNDVPNSFMYETIKDNMTDSYMAEGNGFGATFLHPLSFLRLDHILVDKEINVLRYHSYKTLISDHSLVIASLEF